MHRLIRLRLAKYLAVLTTCTLLIPYAASGALAAVKPAPVPTQTLVVFPMDNGTTTASPQMVDGLSALIRGGLATQAGYHVVAYSERLPAVERLVRLDPEKSHAISGPFYSDKQAIANALALAKSMSADLVLVGTIDHYTVSDKGTAEMGASAELFDVETGKSLRTVVVTGHSGKAIVASATLKPGVDNEAMVDVGEKIVSGVINKDYKTTAAASTSGATTTPKKKKSNAVWIGAAVLAVAVGLLASGHHSGSSSSSTDGPPAPPGF